MKAPSDITTQEFIKLIAKSNESLAEHPHINKSNAAEKALTLLDEDSSFAEKFLARALSIECSTTNELVLDKLFHIWRLLYSTQNYSDLFVGKLWTTYCVKLEASELEDHLSAILSKSNYSFFQILSWLKYNTPALSISSEFALSWLNLLYEKAANDGAITSLYGYTEHWACANPQKALSMITSSSNQKTKTKTDIAARMLGALRPKYESTALKISDALVEEGGDTSITIFLRSWVTSAYRRSILTSEVNYILNNASDQASQNTERYHFLSALFSSIHTQPDAALSGVKWLKTAINDSLPSGDKYFISCAIRSAIFHSSFFTDPEELKNLLFLLPEMQPISENEVGTWSMIVDSLDKLHSILPSEYKQTIRAIYHRNRNAIDNLLPEDSRSHHFIPLEITPALTDLCKDCIFSPVREDRKLGFRLLHHITPNTLELHNLKNLSENTLAIAILQARLSLSDSNLRMDFLIALLPLLQSAKAIKQLYLDELYYEACNMPGGNLDRLLAVSQKPSITRSVVARVHWHIRKAKRADNSSISHICVPGHEAAKRASARQHGQIMGKAMREGSDLLKFLAGSPSTIIYGRSGFHTFHDNQLSEPTNFSQHSHSFEVPQLDLSDDDGQVVRRMHILNLIDELTQQLEKEASNE